MGDEQTMKYAPYERNPNLQKLMRVANYKLMSQRLQAAQKMERSWRSWSISTRIA